MGTRSSKTDGSEQRAASVRYLYEHKPHVVPHVPPNHFFFFILLFSSKMLRAGYNKDCVRYSSTTV
jgi:hypothetical protein